MAEKVTPDNLQAAVIVASFEDPLVNRAYRELAQHYGFLISHEGCRRYPPGRCVSIMAPSPLTLYNMSGKGILYGMSSPPFKLVASHMSCNPTKLYAVLIHGGLTLSYAVGILL